MLWLPAATLQVALRALVQRDTPKMDQAVQVNHVLSRKPTIAVFGQYVLECQFRAPRGTVALT